MRCLVAYALLCSWPAPAYAIDPTQDLAGVGTMTFTRQEGLPQNGITALASTSDGFLWVGTPTGLARFDGITFRVFDKRNTPEMSDHFITALLASHGGGLWIATRSELLFRHRDGSLRRLSSADGLPDDYVRSLFEDSGGHLWLGTYGGGMVLWGGERPRVFGPTDGLLNGFVRAIVEDRAGALWAGTSEGLYRFDGVSFVAHGTDTGMTSGFVRAITEGDDGSIWVGTQGGGLMRYSQGAWSAVSDLVGVPEDSTVWALLVDQDGALWIGSAGQGLRRLHGSRVDALTALDGLAGDVVRNIHEDHEGSIWVGTRGGLTQLRETLATSYSEADGLAHRFVRTAYQDRGGTLWVGGEKGLDSWEDAQINATGHRRWLAGSQVRSILETGDGTMWAGTRNGLFRRTGDRFTPAADPGGSPGAVINALAEDDDGCLWIGTGDGGLGRRCAGVTMVMNEGLPNPVVRSITVASDGAVWVGTEDGLAALRDGRATVLSTNDGLPGEFVYALYEDSDGVLWVGTDAGLARVVNGEISDCGMTGELPTDDVFQILEDAEQHLWLSTKQGLLRVSRHALNQHSGGEGTPVPFTRLDEADGMSSSDCNGGTQPAGWRTEDGRLWFPTYHGINVVDPRRLAGKKPVPNPAFDRMLVDGLEVDFRRPAMLAPGTGEIELRYTAPTFLTPHKTHFRYRLDGFHDGWVDAGSRRSAHFGHLGPGQYRFRVIAANQDNVWSEQEASVTFEIAPHIWQRRWFIGLMAIVLLAVGPALLRYRMVKAARRQQELEALIGERTVELAEANRQLERLATIDFLTGVANHRKFSSYLTDEWRRHIRSRKPLSLIFVDVDRFKLYNDRYGHQAGDRTLRAVAAAFAGIVSRSADLVARYGGEEFAVVLPETELEGALSVAEKGRCTVAALEIEHDSSPEGKYVTVSVGVATIHPQAETTQDILVAAADRALYRAKQEGRNRTCTENEAD